MIKITVLSGPDAGSVFSPRGESIVIGRSHTCDVVLRDGLVGRRHCTLTRQDSRWLLTDLHSANGTFLNDLKTRVATRELRSADEVLLGQTRLRVELSALTEKEVPTASAHPLAGSAPPHERTGRVPAASRTEPAPVLERLDAVRQPDIPIVITVVGGPDRGMVYSPSQEVLSIGRADSCTIVLHDAAASRVHATIRREAGKYRLYDENTRNGTFLRTPSARIFHADITDGDIIYLGRTQLRVEIRLSAPAAAASGDETLISGTLEGKDFTFSLALPVRGAQLPPPEAPTAGPPSHRATAEGGLPSAPTAENLAPRISLQIIEGPGQGATFAPAPGTQSFTVGRGEATDFRLQDHGASRTHFSVELTPTGFILIDKGSVNGTFVNQGAERVSRVTLKDGDEIRVYETRLKVAIILPAEATIAAPLPPSPPGQGQLAGVPPPPTEAEKAAGPGAAPPEPQAPPAVEDVQSRSAAFKERLQVIEKQKGVSLRPFTMPGSPRQWAALLLMLLAAASSYGFILLGQPVPFSGGPVAKDHEQWQNDCAQCHSPWGIQPMNASCVAAGCHVDVLKKGKEYIRLAADRAPVRDDCVSCHTEHRGFKFDIAGGEALCWSCHKGGLGVRRFEARPMRAYYQQLTVAPGALEPKSGKVINPPRLQPPATEEARWALQRSVPHEESGLKYGHAIHKEDVYKEYGKVEDCQDCHKQLPEGQRSVLPTHAECITCHKGVVDRDPQVAKASASQQCLECHTRQEGGITRVQKATTFVNFSHDDHTETGCVQCHFVIQGEQAYRPVLRAAALYPLPMEACYTCHEQQEATVACLDCHGTHHTYDLSTTEVAASWLGQISFGSVLLVFVTLVAGAGAYTYADMRLARQWLAALAPPSSAEGTTTAPAIAPSEAPPPTGEGGVMPFPTVDAATCISCSSCYDSCPTNVLAGDPATHKSIVVNPKACTALVDGCTICQDGCPTGAIRVTSTPLVREVERAQIDEHNETNIPGLFLIGEVVGAALIKKAVNQGDQAVRYIFNRKPRSADAPYDVIIVGAGPAGLGAGLEAKRLGLRYLLVERATLASTIRDYPRDKAVLAEPVLLPQYGLLPMRDDKKESLIAAWEQVVREIGLQVNEREEATAITKTNGLFTVTTVKGSYAGAYVVIGIGTRGNPRKIGVTGEDLPKVAYNLIDAADFKGKKVLIVGGGDSAIEAAVALAKEEGTTVTLSYRRGEFSRIKSRNAQAIAEQEAAGRVTVLFNSQVTAITEKSVTLKVGEEARELENDAIFALIGADPPKAWLEKMGVNIVTIQETVGPQW